MSTADVPVLAPPDAVVGRSRVTDLDEMIRPVAPREMYRATERRREHGLSMMMLELSKTERSLGSSSACSNVASEI